jgi:hypothetical protein
MQTPYAGSSLDELLADDLIQAMMDADKVNPASVRSLFRALARKDATKAHGGIGNLQGGEPESCCRFKI